VKDNAIHMPCILAPTTFSYILNVRVQPPPKAVGWNERLGSSRSTTATRVFALGHRLGKPGDCTGD